MRKLMQVASAAGALVAALPGASAQTVDTSGWECESCPFEEGKVDANLEAGAENVDGARAKFGDFTGQDEDEVYALLDGEASQLREGGTYWSVIGRDLGLDGRQARLEAGKAGRADFSLGYEQLPHTIFDTTSTAFTNARTATQGLPAGFVRSGSTQLMTTLAASLNPLDTGYDREILTAGAGARLGSKWSATLDYERQQREGARRGSASFGFSALEFLEPAEDATDAVVLALAYDSERLTGRIAYEGSFYSQDNPDLTWTNPYSAGAVTGRMALAPDNSAQHLDASLAWRLGTRTTLSATAVVGQLEQDEDLLPFATNPALAGPLPRPTLDAEVDTTHAGLALVTDAGGAWSTLEGLRLRADVRYDERDNSTAQSAWDYVVTDTFATAPVTNLPYSLEHLRYGLSGSWDLHHLLSFVPAGDRLQLSGAWRHDDIERTFQDVSETSEDTGWGRLSYRPAPWLDLAVKLGAASREADDYRASSVLAFPQNPLMRKYHLADRERDFAEGELALMPIPALSFTATGRYAEDEYFDTQVGLQNARAAGTTFAASYVFGGDAASATLSAHYGWDEIDARQRGSASAGAPDWTGLTEDTMRTGGIVLDLPKVAARLVLGVEWFFAYTDSRIEMLSGSLASQPLPTLHTRMHGGELSGQYQWSPALTVRAALRYEHFDADDWQLDGVEPATVPTLLSLGADAYDYDVELVSLSFVYRFGAPAEAAEDETAEEEAKEE